MRQLTCDVCGVEVKSEAELAEIPEASRPEGLADMCKGCHGGYVEKDVMIRDRQDGERAAELRDWLAKKGGKVVEKPAAVAPPAAEPGKTTKPKAKAKKKTTKK